ncbi:hypothetical protein GCM10009120_50130 [Sphingobacterium siyangense subsp. cladoniae]|uniref:aKG-HExxH-type peptide beta-hydroxylase n=1 Tax=Sphingobacterium siyangense TaxID=459529 RepID=UPI0031F875C7
MDNIFLDDVKRYIKRGQLWDSEFINKIVDFSGNNKYLYTTSNAWFSHCGVNLENKNFIPFATIDGNILLEPNIPSLNKFYDEHGLEIYRDEKLLELDVVRKLEAAIKEIKAFPEIYKTVKSLVRAIQVIHVEDPEYDSSYTHPNIPFSIFVSVGKDISAISNLRVAESIIHETMHLQLTLIENFCPFVKIGSMEEFYSPWRDELRPIRGVLHGVYVFSAIKDFYKRILPFLELKTADFASYRVEQIEDELSQINDFKKNSDLTEYGANLVISLLP